LNAAKGGIWDGIQFDPSGLPIALYSVTFLSSGDVLRGNLDTGLYLFGEDGVKGEMWRKIGELRWKYAEAHICEFKCRTIKFMKGKASTLGNKA
jgi:hypothetical protein